MHAELLGWQNTSWTTMAMPDEFTKNAFSCKFGPVAAANRVRNELLDTANWFSTRPTAIAVSVRLASTSSTAKFKNATSRSRRSGPRPRSDPADVSHHGNYQRRLPPSRAADAVLAFDYHSSEHHNDGMTETIETTMTTKSAAASGTNPTPAA